MKWIRRLFEPFARWVLREDLHLNEHLLRLKCRELCDSKDDVWKLKRKLEDAEADYREKLKAHGELPHLFMKHQLMDKREAVLRAFGAVDHDDPLLVAVRTLAEHAWEEANELATSPDMARSPGEAAHSAGGAYWLSLLSARLRDAWVEAHRLIEKEPA